MCERCYGHSLGQYFVATFFATLAENVTLTHCVDYREAFLETSIVQQRASEGPIDGGTTILDVVLELPSNPLQDPPVGLNHFQMSKPPTDRQLSNFTHLCHTQLLPTYLFMPPSSHTLRLVLCSWSSCSSPQVSSGGDTHCS